MMDSKKRKLNEFLEMLSENPLGDATRQDMVEKFTAIYISDPESLLEFRHSYGSITGKLLKLEEANADAIDNICTNLEDIVNTFKQEIESYREPLLPEQTQRILVYQKFEKLLDHISLEKIRLDFLYKEYENRIEKTAKEAVKEYKRATKLSRKATKNLTNIKMEVVAILSIFAAIVLTFSAGIGFVKDVMVASISPSLCEKVILISVCGIVLFNVVFVLMYLVSKIVDKPIGVSCLYDNCYSCTDIKADKNGSKQTIKRPACSLFGQLWRRFPYVLIVNLLLIVIIFTSNFFLK